MSDSISLKTLFFDSIRLYIFIGGLCYRSWERLEIPFYNRTIWRSIFRFNLYFIFIILCFADFSNGICCRPSLSKKRQ